MLLFLVLVVNSDLFQILYIQRHKFHVWWGKAYIRREWPGNEASGFLDFKVDFWISVWTSGFQLDFCRGFFRDGPLTQMCSQLHIWWGCRNAFSTYPYKLQSLLHPTVQVIGRVSNLKYEVVRIDSKTVVFTRVNRKTPQTDRVRMLILFGNSALFRKW